MSTIAQPVPFFGRAFSLTVTPQSGGQQYTISSASATPALRVVFDVETWSLMKVWSAKITIFNLGASTASAIAAGSVYNLASAQGQITPTLGGQSLLFTQSLNQGNLVSLSAGYQQPGSASTFNPASNLIYKGNLLQSYGTRENVTDTKLVLRCIVNLALVSFAFTNMPRGTGPGENDYAALQAIMGQINVAISNIDSASQQALQNSTYSRGQAIFGRTTNIVNSICTQNNVFPWIGFDGLNVRSNPATSPLTPKIIYAPPNLKNQPTGSATTAVKPTIIGTPAQTQDGVVFRVLMDTQVKLWDTIQLALGTAINSFEFPYGTLPPLPNASGTYIVVGLRYHGDSRGRGDDWFTELTCLTPQWFAVNAMVRSAVGAQ